MDRIPRITFQTWKSRNDLPNAFRAWRQTIIDMNPSYRHIIWDDDDNRRFIDAMYPWFLPTYDGYEANIMRVDAVRYFFLYSFGGIYIDLDTECLRPLDQHLNEADVILGRMGVDPDFSHSLPNAIMMSAPEQEFWLFVIQLLLDRASQEGRPEFKTGPEIIKKAFDIYTDPRSNAEFRAGMTHLLRLMKIDATGLRPTELMVAHPRLFYPVDWTDAIHQFYIRRPIVRDGRRFTEEEKQALFPGSSLVTYWTHSWEAEEWA